LTHAIWLHRASQWVRTPAARLNSPAAAAQGVGAWLREAGVVVWRQFSAATVTPREYSTLRASFYFAHGEGLGGFSGEIFHPYLTGGAGGRAGGPGSVGCRAGCPVSRPAQAAPAARRSALPALLATLRDCPG
jgi:hypothetical protein